MTSPAATRAVHLLAERHLPALQRLAADPAIAATTRVPHPYPADGAAEFFRHVERERAAGTAQVFAIVEREELVGVIGLHHVTTRDAELGFWVGVPHQRRGHATFAVANVQQFAFANLRLQALWAEALAGNTACVRLLERAGFVATAERAHENPVWPAAMPLRRFELAAGAWRERRDAPALAALHPALRALLAAELAAGNEVRETSRGWPDPDSVLVRLQRPFAALPAVLPAGVVHRVLNDPHWWRAELATTAPRHLLIC